MKFKIFNRVSEDTRDKTKTEKKVTLDVGETTLWMGLAGLVFLDPVFTPTLIALGMILDEKIPEVETKTTTTPLERPKDTPRP